MQKLIVDISPHRGERCVALGHDNPKKFGTVSPGTDLTGRLRRQAADDLLDLP